LWRSLKFELTSSWSKSKDEENLWLTSLFVLSPSKQCKHRALQELSPGITADDVKAEASNLNFSLEEISHNLAGTLYSNMSAPRLIHRLARPVTSSLSPVSRSNRQFGTSVLRLNASDEAIKANKEYRDNQAKKPANQFVPNTTSTMTKDFPNVGKKPSPPEMLNSVDPNYRPADPYPGRIEHFTGGRQDTGAQKPELGVGEMEGITFKVEPLKRVGEEVATKRARLLCSFPIYASS
jgi:hypothetical protein